MEPFNLKEYLKNPSKKVITQKGDPVRIICTDRKDTMYPIVALVGKKEDHIETYGPNGNYHLAAESVQDLVFAPIKSEGYINIYKDELVGNFVCGHTFKIKEEAEKLGKSSPRYITTIKIEWEE